LNRVLRPLTKALERIRHRPRLSLVVIIYKMPEQAKNTLYSLSTAYQQGVLSEEYEVIVIENHSDKTLGADVIEKLPENFSYFLRNETLPTPVYAINFGASKAQGESIGLMIDGARMATPGLVRTILDAQKISPNTVVAVPGYHLGQTVQQEAINTGYNEDTEKALLNSIKWKENGYKLFDIGCFSASSRPGFFRPISESNCLSIPKHIWQSVRGIDERFTTPGGGLANLDLYKRVCEYDKTNLVITPGEGTFHQFHGGVTTGQKKSLRDKAMKELFAEYERIRGGKYQPPKKQACIFGAISDSAIPYLEHSINMTKR